MEEYDATEISHKILSAVSRTEQRFGMNHVSMVLRGKASQKIVDRGHDKLTVFGIVPDFSDAQLKQIMRLLISKELLAKSDGEYPTLSLTRAGESVVRGRQPVNLTRPKQEAAIPKTDSTGRGSGRSRLEAGEISREFNLGLFERLRGVRRGLADARGVPPYVVFSDLSLQQMAYSCPQSLDAFSRISGVGRVKLEDFGEEFVAEIRDYSQEHGLVERATPTGSIEMKRPKQHAGSTSQQTKKFLSEKALNRRNSSSSRVHGAHHPWSLGTSGRSG